ncbi:MULTISPECIES: ArsR/SmtB family transcription factor [unclassified Streptomyces]|uniref:ArsR/SmtB family transcription factor n=1 Tax=unclassified Streptomyces TaxID=2593676 RepID=UPI00225967D5|nr:MULTISPECIES: helix-turn-helix domain-containing protein [unclassified Streptomyces]WSP58266.1 helix-turn-helix domain-containing protein [Streptomyces sp. NBC_01241]WSU21156.1 helix-turn-helix domain-containing protein [Streptomyces sp. NBC_01108]MCX4794259.1 helix-turn-helix domain-containing protein [Streptomyces sp. NBC_01242]WSJ35650.1 helix-turn-helix domain-containing protein [Streptomyces sp. NBC_01321]WSP62078.1 helix-turn-helix domain-containing protein [Streptomyces sp. NBC_01240
MVASSAAPVGSAAAPVESVERDIELDTAALRVLAHPLRLSVLGLLRDRGPSTATRVAEEFGINPGAASYHLRRLASGGLIVEEPDRGTGRERWWKSAHRQSVHDPATGSAEQREAGRGYTHAVALAAADRLRRSAQELALLPREWLDVATYSDFLLHLTPGDVDRMRAEIFEVISRYRQSTSEAPEGSSPVTLQVQAFPVPGTAVPPAGDA